MVTHKELLTFSNLTNLEWEFVELYDNETGRKKDNTFLRGLLDPENFVRIDEEENEFGDNVNYVYGERDQNGNYIRETGLMELRQKAGIAMEYLEKLDAGNEEGAFLKDWEVIYGADKYKIMEEYLKERWEPIHKVLTAYLNELEASEKSTNDEKEKDRIQKEKKEVEDFLEEKHYPSREELTPEHKRKVKLEIAVEEYGIKLLTTTMKEGPLEIKYFLDILLEKIMDKVGEKSKDFSFNLIKKINVKFYLFIKFWHSYKDMKDLYDLAEEYLELMEEGQLEEIDEIVKDEGLEGVKFIEEIDMYDEARYKKPAVGYGEEFRVLALKKTAEDGRDQIVIAYKGKKIGNKKVLPDELQLLQLVHARITAEYPDARITFTGCKGGADLSFINTLFSYLPQSYTVQEGDDLSKIGEALAGENWEGKLFKDEDCAIPYTRNDHLIQGDKVYYSPGLNNDTSTVLFHDDLEGFLEMVSFNEYKMDSDYEPVITYTIEGIGDILKEKTISFIESLAINGVLILMLNAAKHKSVIKVTTAVYNYISFLGFFRIYLSPDVMGLMLSGQIGTLIKGIAVLFKTSLVNIIIATVMFFGSKLVDKAIDNMYLDKIYKDLVELGFLLAKKEEDDEEEKMIEGYITDKFLKEGYVEFTAYEEENGVLKPVKVNVEREYAIYIKNQELNGRLTLRRDNMGGDSLFIPFVALPDYYLRFTKINGIYRLKSVVIKNDDHTAPKIEEIKDAEENYREYYSNPYKNSYEWNVESIFEVKSRIYKIKKKEYLAENEKEEIKKLEDKIMVLEYLKNTMQKYVNLVELINIFGRLQRLYEKSGEIIELIYPDYSGEAKEQIIISSGIPESIENIDINPLYANINEYTFQPFINAESGNLDPAVLREDYKASLIKSMIYHYIAYHRSFGQKDSNYNDIKADKYDRQYNFNYVFDFVQKRVGSIFLEMMETGFDNILNWELSQLKFNHYQYILDRLDEEEIKKYYEFDPEESSHFTSATIIINPDSAKQIEYKYNPVDDIVGGELVIQARNYIEDDETEETAQEEASQKLSPGQLISALSSIPVFAGQRESIFDLIPEEYRERYNFLKEKARIYDKGQELLKTAEEDIAGSEEIKEEELKVGRERIYTGANRRQSSEAEKRLIRKIFNIAEGQKIEETVKSLGGEISREKEYSAEVYRDEKEEDIVINYSPVDHEDRATLLSLAAGLPNEQFDRAERTYREEVRENGTGYKYTLTGVSLGASFAQYAALMSEGFVNNYQAIGYNSIGLEQCLRFNGNEFLGYQIGIYHYLKKLLDGDNTMETILADLIDEGVIVYDNISPQYRKGEKINEEKLKAVLVDIFTRRLGLEEERAKEIIEKNFNPLIVQRKMRLMDRHREYRNWLKREKEKDRIVNYLYSGNLPALLLAQAGSSYLVDRGLQKLEDEGRKEIIREKAKLAEGLPERDFRIAKAGDLDLFLPYLYIKEEGISQKRLKNRTGEKPQTGNICNCLSLDYLKALVRDVVHDLKGKDPEALKKLFWFHRAQSPAAMLEVIKDRLRYSMVLQKKLPDEISVFRNPYFKEIRELYTGDEKIYPLAESALRQLEEMTALEREKLYRWQLTGEGIFLILCEKEGEEQDDTVITYHSSDSAISFDNKEERLELETDEPSRNRIFGSARHGRYIAERDNEYLNEEKNIYQFSNTRGLGYEILSADTDTDREIEIDGRNISAEHEEIDRESADIGERQKLLEYKYFGSNIILKNRKRVHGELTGDLIYIYGPGKKDQLTIAGFVNGDYGIKLLERAQEKSEEKALLTYTEHRVKVDPFEFVILDELEIVKELYEHTRVRIKGVIREEDAERYYTTLTREDPAIIITYDDDDSKILFKGIVENYRLGWINQDYYLELEALSYSVLLERRKKNRIYQNQGTTYNEAFRRLMEDNPEFHISFSKSSTGDVPLVSEDYPVVMQYKESEWDFIRRLSSYLGQILIVDDTKDNNEKINIQAGYHNNVPKDLNNIGGGSAMRTGRKNINYRFFKITGHEHYRSDNIFDVGKKVKYRLNNREKPAMDLIIIKNRIYLNNQRLCSDLNLVREEDINVLKEIREKPIEGRSFRAEVVKVNKKHQVKVKFIDIDDDFREDKAYWFTIDQLYSNAFIAPELGDIVDIYFKSSNEKFAALKSSTTDEKEQIDHDPADKLIRTPGGYQIKLNNEEVLMAAKDRKSWMRLKEEETILESNGSRISMDVEKIVLHCRKASVVIKEDMIQIAHGNTGLKIKKGQINLS